ncbi:hypothetical protein Btru_016950, partial [Bulinus truncatus]
VPLKNWARKKLGMATTGRRAPPPPPLTPMKDQDPPPPPLPKRVLPPTPKDEQDVTTEDEYLQPVVQAQDLYEPMSAPNPVTTPPLRKQGFTATPELNIISNLEKALKLRKEKLAEAEPETLEKPFMKPWNQEEVGKINVSKSPFNNAVNSNANSEKEKKMNHPLKQKLGIQPLFGPEKPVRIPLGTSLSPMSKAPEDIYEEPGPPPRIHAHNTRPLPCVVDDDESDDSWGEEWEDGQVETKKDDGDEIYIVADGADDEYQQPDEGKPPPLPPIPSGRTFPNKQDIPPVVGEKPQSQVKVIPVEKPSSIVKVIPVEKPQSQVKVIPVEKPSSIVKEAKKLLDKPTPPLKPTKNLTNGPQLPQRSQNQQENKRDSRSDDNSSTDSVTLASLSGSSATTNGGQDLRSQSKPQEAKTIPAPSHSEEIYDDASTETLEIYDWFHPNIDRKDAERRVLQKKENGIFLVRTSMKEGSNHPYTLVVLYEGKIKNLPLRERNDKRFAIGKFKAEEVSFASIPELITHHKSSNIKLAEGGTVILTNTPPKR